ncbi:MAG: endonuclease [Succinivibrio sp.]|nr:endonuclease [Succinivibrio sp.]
MNRRFAIGLGLLGAVLQGLSQSALGMDDFQEAKKVLLKIYRQLPAATTLYTGCALNWRHGYYYPDLGSCGYVIQEDAKRGRRIEVEHIVPAYVFGRTEGCWVKHKGRGKGRQNCQHTSASFNRMEGDLHNLYPAVGEVNNLRGHLSPGEVHRKSDGRFGEKIDLIIDAKQGLFQPPPEARGIVARAYLYMEYTYKIPIHTRTKELMLRWDDSYPPTALECERNRLIVKYQGNDNPYVTKKCQAQNFKD